APADLAAHDGPREQRHHTPVHPSLDGRHRRRVSTCCCGASTSLQGAAMRVASPPLPPVARAFLASLAPTHRPATRATYAGALRKFHGWLDRRSLGLSRLTRRQIVPWFQELHAAGLHPSTRHLILVDIRAYLYWVSEHQRMRTTPDDLIRA